MIIKTLYKPGDKVWIVGSTPVTKDCPDCGGEGSLETKTGTYQACQLCRGSGEVITREVFTALPKPLEIQCVRAHINRGQAKPTIEYYIQDDPHSERICFRCQEEAESAAKKWNFDKAVERKGGMKVVRNLLNIPKELHGMVLEDFVEKIDYTENHNSQSHIYTLKPTDTFKQTMNKNRDKFCEKFYHGMDKDLYILTYWLNGKSDYMTLGSKILIAAFIRDCKFEDPTFEVGMIYHIDKSVTEESCNDERNNLKEAIQGELNDKKES